jgi:hypothetical protein
MVARERRNVSRLFHEISQVRIMAQRPVNLTEGFCGFPQSLQINTRTAEHLRKFTIASKEYHSFSIPDGSSGCKQIYQQ